MCYSGRFSAPVLPVTIPILHSVVTHARSIPCTANRFQKAGDLELAMATNTRLVKLQLSKNTMDRNKLKALERKAAANGKQRTEL